MIELYGRTLVFWDNELSYSQLHYTLKKASDARESDVNNGTRLNECFMTTAMVLPEAKSGPRKKSAGRSQRVIGLCHLQPVDVIVTDFVTKSNDQRGRGQG